MLLICHFGALLHGWELIFSIFADAKCDTFIICISQPVVLISFHSVPNDPTHTCILLTKNMEKENFILIIVHNFLCELLNSWNEPCYQCWKQNIWHHFVMLFSIYFPTYFFLHICKLHWFFTKSVSKLTLLNWYNPDSPELECLNLAC